MDINKAIKKMILERNVTQQAIGEVLGMSKSNFNQLINRDDLRINTDLIRIASAIGFNVRIHLIDRETGKVIEVD